ncbi:MAG: DUF1778 domain-containing protein [Opitutaceae bacterium]|jgi:uncharacterized protein (DUF1778 family)
MSTIALPTTREEARLEARVTSDFKALIEKAASLSGYSSVKDFIIATMSPVAEQVVERHTRIRLTQDEGKVFVEALLNPPRPNAKLLRAMQAHKKLVRA